jgi:hypothetical protein
MIRRIISVLIADSIAEFSGNFQIVGCFSPGTVSSRYVTQHIKMRHVFQGATQSYQSTNDLSTYIFVRSFDTAIDQIRQTGTPSIFMGYGPCDIVGNLSLDLVKSRAE